MNSLRTPLVVLLLSVTALPLVGQAVRRVTPVRSHIDLKVGQSDSVRFQYFDQRKTELDPAKLKLAYRSQDTAIVTVNPKTGVLLGRAVGATQVGVTVGDRSHPRYGWVQVSVDAVPAPPPLPTGHLEVETRGLHLIPGEGADIIARVIGPNSLPAPESQLGFRAINREIATVDGLTGRVTALKPGQTEVEITAPGLESRVVMVEVSSDELGLNTDSLFLLVGIPDTIRVLVPNQKNRPYSGAITWNSSNPNVARIDGNDGVLVPVTSGDAEISVETAGFQKAVWVKVYEKGTARSLPSATDAPLQLPFGSRTQFSVRAIATDGSGAVLYEVPATWTVSDTTIMAFDQSAGVLTALRAGNATLTALPRLKAMARPRVWQIEVVGGRLVPESPIVGLRVGMKATVNALFVDSAGRRAGQPVPVTWGDLDSPVVRLTSASQLEVIGIGRALVTGRVSWGDSVRVNVLGLSDITMSMAMRGSTTGIYGLQLHGSRDAVEVVPIRGTQEYQASVSPDRSRMVFVSNRGGKEMQLWLADADGANPQLLTTGSSRNDQPVWSRDGRWIAFTSSRSGLPRIYAVRPDGTGLHAVTDSAVAALAPSFSPDGTLLTFQLLRKNQYDVDGVRVDSAMARLPRPEEALLTSEMDERTPRYFPNGDLAFIGQERSGKRLSRLYRKVSPSLTPALTPADLYVLDYAIAPDGLSVVVAASGVGKQSASNPVQLYLIDPRLGATGTPTPLYRAPTGGVGSPAFVP